MNTPATPIPRQAIITKKRGEWPLYIREISQEASIAADMLKDSRLQAWRVTITVEHELQAVPPSVPTLEPKDPRT